MKTKYCPKCERDRSIDEFGKNRSMKDGLAARCKGCRSEEMKEYYGKNQGPILQQKKEYLRKNRGRINQRRREHHKQNPERVNQRSRRYYNTVVGQLQHIFSNIKRRCSNSDNKDFKNYGGRGIENKFGSSDEFVSYITEVLGVDPRGLQIDRIDNDGHYEEGNIRFVTCKTNNNNRRCSKKMVVA